MRRKIQFSISISHSNMEKQSVNNKKTSKWTHFWQKCEKLLGQVQSCGAYIIHEESGDMEFFHQSSTRYLSSERSSKFPHLANHIET